MTIEINLAAAEPLIKHVISSGLVPMIHGSPAIGKSDIVRKIAHDGNLELIDVRLSTYDPTDMNGLPFFNRESGKAEYSPMETFPLATDKLPEGKKGWLIFLDELPSASHAVQAAAFKLILDRMVGCNKLHPRAFMVAAGNTEDDGAIVNALPTPLQSRLINFKVVAEFKSWLKWALQNNLDYRIAAYLQFDTESFHAFDANHDDMTFASPRTWMFLSKMLGGKYPVTTETLPLIAGTVSEAVGRKFVAFVKQYESLTTMEQIVKNPQGAKMPGDNPSVIYAIAGMIGGQTTKENLTPVMEYIERMPMEFQVVTLRNVFGRNPELGNEAVVNTWITKYGSELF